MPILEVGGPAAVAANVLFWAAAHSISGYLAHRLPAASLSEDGWLLRLSRFERGGRFYDRVLRIRTWKDRLPEAGAIFAGGVSKRRVPAGPDAVETFARETRRAELGHWWSLVPLPACALWNPPLGMLAMVVYGFVVNVPFIAVQRYNRGRCQRILAARAERSRASRSRADDDEPPRSGSSIP